MQEQKTRLRNILEHFGIDDEKIEDIEQQVAEEKELRQRQGDQVLPKANDEVPCHYSLLDIMRHHLPQRLGLGVRRYGQPLQPFNGRNFSQDALEEYLDLGVYLDGLIRERQAMIDVLKKVAQSNENLFFVREARELLLSMGIGIKVGE